MKNALKKGWQHLLFLCLMLSAIAPLNGHAHGVPVSPIAALSCTPPSVSKTGQSAGYIAFAWSPVEGASGYQIWYVNKGTNNSSWVYSTGNTSIDFSNLPSGNYSFYFKTVCEDTESGIIVLDELII